MVTPRQTVAKPSNMSNAYSHDSSLCKKSPNVPAKCVNRGGDHTANYTKCPALLKYLDKKAKFTNPSLYKSEPPPLSIPVQKLFPSTTTAKPSPNTKTYA